MKKFVLYTFLLFFLMGLLPTALEAQANYKINPYTGRRDYYVQGLITGVSGDIVYHDGTNWVRLAKGANGEIFTLAAGLPSWVAAGIPGAHASTHEVGGADLVDHDALTNFLASEHIDWTNATEDFLTTGAGTFRVDKRITLGADPNYNDTAIKFLDEWTNFYFAADAQGRLDLAAPLEKSMVLSLYADVGEDGSGSWTPNLTFKASYEENEVYLLSNIALKIWTNSDLTDYIRFQTISDVPEITTIGNCNLKLTASSGLIDFDDDNVQTLGKGTFDKLVLTDNVISYDDIMTGDKLLWAIQSTYTGASGSCELAVVGPVGKGMWLALYGDGPVNLSPYIWFHADYVNSQIKIGGNTAVDILPNDEWSDYFRLQVISGVPEITTIGNCNLKLSSSSGTIDFDDDDVQTSGNIKGATYASDGSVSDVEFKYINTLSSNAQDQLDGKLANLVEDLTPELGGSLDSLNLDLDNIRTATFNSEVDNGTVNTTHTINWNSGQKQKVTLDGACTFTFTAPKGPCHLTLVLITAGNDPTWPAGVDWSDATEPTWSAAGKYDTVTFYFRGGTTYTGGVMLNYTI